MKPTPATSSVEVCCNLKVLAIEPEEFNYAHAYFSESSSSFLYRGVKSLWQGTLQPTGKGMLEGYYIELVSRSDSGYW
jgi:hypothetical protein